MVNYKVNYDKLQKLKQIHFEYLLFFIIIMSLIILISTFFIKVSKRVSFYGILNDNIISINVNSTLSDKLQNGHMLKFKDTYLDYEIVSYGEYKIVNNEVIQDINLKVNMTGYNMVGEVTLFYDEVRLVNFILALFK